MRKFIFAFVALLVSAGIFLACSNEEAITSIKKREVLHHIKSDIAQQKYYPNVHNKYDYSSKNFRAFLMENSSLFNHERATSRDSVSYELYKQAVSDFYRGSDHSQAEIDNQFAITKSLFQYSSYETMLDDFVNKGIIPHEEREIILEYIDYYYQTEDFDELANITSIFVNYVNQSDFSEFEKRGMLTVFDTFRENRRLFDETEPFDFLQFIEAATVIPDGRPSKDTECGGRMIIGMVGGGLLGNGLGFIIGTATAVFENWNAGCFD